MASSRTIWTLAFCILISIRSQAQTTVDEDIPANFSAAWFQIDNKKELAIAVGNVQITWMGGSLRCDNAIMWGISTSKGKLSLREIYAEGKVLVRHDENRYVLESARGFVDPVLNRGVFFDTAISMESDGRDGPVRITARAAEAVQLAENRFELKELRLTTSPFSEPGYHVSADALRLQVDPPAPRPGGRPNQLVRNVRYQLDGSVLNLEGAPIFPMPDISGNTADDSFNWLKRLSVESSGRFGPSILASVGTPISFDNERWGDWTLHTRFLGDRGPGVGLDLSYRQPDYTGRFEGFYQRDRGRDRLLGLPPDNNRGRVLWRHRHKLPENIQLDLELSKITDRGFLPEYYEREFKEDKDQETLIYLKRVVENRAATFIASTRLNEFQDQVEQQPQIGYNLISEPLFDIGDTTLYFDADYEVSRVRRRFDDATGLNDIDSFRADFDNKISAPLFAGPIKLTPFAGFRYSYYSNSQIGEESRHRIGALFGLLATTQLSRTFDLHGGLFNLKGLRHIITPEIEYTSISYVSNSIATYPQFDRIDAFTEQDSIRVGVRNRLQTIWESNGQDQVVDIVDFDVEWTFFPDANRDNFGEHAGNLDVDLLVRFSPKLTFLLDMEHSFRLKNNEVLNTTLGYAPSKEFQAAIGFRRYIGVNDALIFHSQWRPVERLALRGLVGYDFEDNRFQDARLSVVRFGADWVFEAEFSWDNDGDFGFGISFSPRALFDPRIRARSLRHQPRLYDFGRNVIR